MVSGERGMNPVAVTIINPRKEHWSSRGSNQRPPVLKSCWLPTELWGSAIIRKNDKGKIKCRLMGRRGEPWREKKSTTSFGYLSFFFCQKSNDVQLEGRMKVQFVHSSNKDSHGWCSGSAFVKKYINNWNINTGAPCQRRSTGIQGHTLTCKLRPLKSVAMSVNQAVPVWAQTQSDLLQHCNPVTILILEIINVWKGGKGSAT